MTSPTPLTIEEAAQTILDRFFAKGATVKKEEWDFLLDTLTKIAQQEREAIVDVSDIEKEHRRDPAKITQGWIDEGVKIGKERAIQDAIAAVKELKEKEREFGAWRVRREQLNRAITALKSLLPKETVDLDDNPQKI